MTTPCRALLAAALACVCLPALAQEPSNPINSQVKIYGILNTRQSTCIFEASSVENAISVSTSNAGSPSIRPNPVTIVKPVDSCSPTIFANTLIAAHAPYVGLLVHPTQPGERNYVMFFQNAAFTALSTAATADKVLQESVSLSYDTVSVAELTPSFGVVSCFGFNLTRRSEDNSGCSEIPRLIKQFVPSQLNN